LHSSVRFVCLLALAAASCAASAQTIPVPRYEEDAKAEITVPLPAPPKPENLLRFPTNWTTNEIYVDTASIAFANDEVINYTLVVRGAGGGQNITFESLRCNTGERRVHAYGRRDGSWSATRRNEWMPILDTGINRYYFEFYRDVFCQGKSLETRREVLANIKRGGRERADSPASE
jgi:hypothetical protein